MCIYLQFNSTCLEWKSFHYITLRPFCKKFLVNGYTGTNNLREHTEATFRLRQYTPPKRRYVCTKLPISKDSSLNNHSHENLISYHQRNRNCNKDLFAKISTVRRQCHAVGVEELKNLQRRFVDSARYSWKL